MTGAMLRGKTADAGLNIGARLCDTRKKRATASRFLFSEYKLHIAGYRTRVPGFRMEWDFRP